MSPTVVKTSIAGTSIVLLFRSLILTSNVLLFRSLILTSKNDTSLLRVRIAIIIAAV